MAMNPAARVKLIDQLKAHTMQREYVAYVGGRVPAPQGTWRNWLKLGEDELRQSVVAAAEATRAGDEIAEAITHYEVLTEFPVAGGTGVITKLRLRLETGRKHQIRVQAAHAGLPLVGDRTYHARYHRGVPKAPRIDFPRQALHADVLSLEHPNRSGQRMTWTAPLPEDLQQLEARLRSTLPPRNHWA
jgi:23S rRNA pseudouridine1911/1915/1917 synthase